MPELTDQQLELDTFLTSSCRSIRILALPFALPSWLTQLVLFLYFYSTVLILLLIYYCSILTILIFVAYFGAQLWLLCRRWRRTTKPGPCGGLADPVLINSERQDQE